MIIMRYKGESISMRTFKSTLAVACGTVLFTGLLLTTAAAQNTGVYAYPSAGQPQDQQDRDRWECQQWATRETGFDPATAAPLPAAPYAPPPPRQRQRQANSSVLGIGNGGFFEGSGMLGDAATGAALGAAGGAIAGDAGQGAAIGAVASTLFGALNRSSNNSSYDNYEDQRYSQQQYEHQRIMQERQLAMESYRRAYGACMGARNYTVQ